MCSTDYGAINWDKTTKDNSFSLLPQMRKSQNKKIAKLTPVKITTYTVMHLYLNCRLAIEICDILDECVYGSIYSCKMTSYCMSVCCL